MLVSYHEKYPSLYYRMSKNPANLIIIDMVVNSIIL
jgi:hypothetical protein